MLIDEILLDKSLGQSGVHAARAEAAGHSGVFATESGVDPFLQAHAGIMATERITVGTAIAVALARTPMTVAYSAWNLAEASRGRFVLGLGTQVKPHIERRYSMPWVSPLGQMREFLEALRAIWGSWRTGEALQYRGEHYTHTLMSPFWRPIEHDHEIPILLAAVGPRMTTLAAEAADGAILHAFTNRAYLEKVTIPALDEGLTRAGRSAEDLQVSIPLMMIMGDTDEELEARRADAVRQLAFYGSTPSYRPVLEVIGYADLQEELTVLSKRNAWDDMSSLITDELLDHFAVTGRPEDMPRLAREHLGPRVGRTSSYFGWRIDDPDRLRAVLGAFHDGDESAP